jgi:hypothetical protein
MKGDAGRTRGHKAGNVKARSGLFLARIPVFMLYAVQTKDGKALRHYTAKGVAKNHAIDVKSGIVNRGIQGRLRRHLNAISRLYQNENKGCNRSAQGIVCGMKRTSCPTNWRRR